MTQPPMTDHDLLVRLDERVETILTWTKAHDYAHSVLRERIDSTDTETRNYRLKEIQRVESLETKWAVLGGGLLLVAGGVVAVVVALITNILK